MPFHLIEDGTPWGNGYAVVEDHGPDPQPMKYRFVPDAEDPGVWVCELDPHRVDEWTSFGRHRSTSKALWLALKAWREFDDQP